MQAFKVATCERVGVSAGGCVSVRVYKAAVFLSKRRPSMICTTKVSMAFISTNYFLANGLLVVSLIISPRLFGMKGYPSKINTIQVREGKTHTHAHQTRTSFASRMNKEMVTAICTL